MKTLKAWMCLAALAASTAVLPGCGGDDRADDEAAAGPPAGAAAKNDAPPPPDRPIENPGIEAFEDVDPPKDGVEEDPHLGPDPTAYDDTPPEG